MGTGLCLAERAGLGGPHRTAACSWPREKGLEPARDLAKTSAGRAAPAAASPLGRGCPGLRGTLLGVSPRCEERQLPSP